MFFYIYYEIWMKERSFCLRIIDSFCWGFSPLSEGPAGASSHLTVFQLRGKTNICLFLLFYPTSRWPKMTSWPLNTYSAWTRATWGTAIPTRSIVYFPFRVSIAAWRHAGTENTRSCFKCLVLVRKHSLRMDLCCIENLCCSFTFM